jgi:hypothetical protein
MRNCDNVYSVITVVIKLRSAKWAGACRTHGSNNKRIQSVIWGDQLAVFSGYDTVALSGDPSCPLRKLRFF